MIRMENSSNNSASGHSFGLDLMHDFGGALLFSFPLLMTMEMWWLGFYMDRFRLSIFLIVSFFVVVGLSYYEGGEQPFMTELLDAFVAFAAGYMVSGTMLLVFGVIEFGMSADEMIGKVSLHAVPCSIGAILARKQLGLAETNKERRRRRGYWAKIFLMAVGAIFLAFQLAPTEEMVLIGYKMTGWHAAVLVLLSLLVMQIFICEVERRERNETFASCLSPGVFLFYTIVGYSTGLLISLYVLWTFERLNGVSMSEAVLSMIVLAFPAALGASAARLIL
jgi:putative integral membrane protein (TIGR02587 family)